MLKTSEEKEETEALIIQIFWKVLNYIGVSAFGEYFLVFPMLVLKLTFIDLDL